MCYAVGFQPAANGDTAALAQYLTRSLYPGVHTADLRVLREKELGFGRYTLSYEPVFRTEDEFVRAAYSRTVPQAKRQTNNAPRPEELFFVPYTFFSEQPAASPWSDLKDDKFYLCFFALSSQEEHASSDVVFQQYYKRFTVEGTALAQWVGFKTDTTDRIWGLRAPSRPDAPDRSLFSLFALLDSHGDVTAYLDKTNLFGDLLGLDFAALRDADRGGNYAFQAVGAALYGRGAQIKAFRDDADIRLVKAVPSALLQMGMNIYA